MIAPTAQHSARCCSIIDFEKLVARWMLRKIVARFLPPTSFAEAVEFLEKALDVNYYDTRAAAVRESSTYVYLLAKYHRMTILGSLCTSSVCAGWTTFALLGRLGLRLRNS